MNSEDIYEEFDLDSNDFDVIIIGGGLTGLTAAYKILKKQSGLSLLIIERDGLIGGRLQYPDRGFYYHSFQNHISQLVDELNLNNHPTCHNNDKRRIFYTNYGPKQSRNSSIIACETYYFIKSLQHDSNDSRFKIYTQNDQDSYYLATISVDDYINQLVMSTEARLICKSLIFALFGISDVTKISCLWFFVTLHNAGGFFQRLKLSLSTNTKYFIQGGMLKMINRLKDRIFAENGVIQCSEDVKRIKTNDFRAWVTTSVKTYKCNYVIIAVPPPQSLQIAFEALPSLETLITQQFYHSTSTIYFEAVYKSAFWIPNYSGSIITTPNSGTELKMAYDASYHDQKQTNILAGFLSQEPTVENLFTTINKSFNTDEAENYLQYHERQKIDGQMSVLKPCAFAFHLNPILKPLQRIYFAASEYARYFPGTVDGAIEAGENVACSVLYHARPQVLTTLEIIKYIPRSVPPISRGYSEIDAAFFTCLITNIIILCIFLKRV